MKTAFTTSHGLSLKILLVIFLAAVSLCLLRPLVAGNGKDKELPKSSLASENLSSQPTELARRIDSTIEQSDLGAARLGISVISMVDGSTVYKRDSDKLFTPASNMKIYTTGVALDLLGAEYRWRTSVYANSQPDANGEVRGDLILYGRGAPDLVASSNDPTHGTLQKLADDLYARGVRKVSGNVVGDESYFRGNPLGDGWQWNDLQWYFGAEASALSINGNEVDVNFLPAAKAGASPVVRTSDTENYVTVQNQMAAVGRSGRPTIGVHRGLSDNNIEVWGEFAPDTKGFGARLSVYKPALWAAKLFARALKARGIEVEGQPISRDSRIAPSQRFDPSHSVELVFVQSQPLGEIARKTNKESNNLYAELILRTLGRERGDTAGLPEAPGRERGDDEAGLAVIRAWLERAGIATDRLALHDGCGLSRLDLVTPETSARFLLALTRTSAGSVFKDSLPLSGHDGTLAGRLETIKDRVSAKTGSLTYDNSLSGYLTTAQGQTLVFSIMCNDQTRRATSIRLIDQIVTLLADYPNLPAEKSQKSE
ncbi:MAG TPA: D-alanyl-D-alanine carboxypeptidase/D-alanyl-D-alanine-endopeptidase, partial [Pyrinomonadaceae bacterium]|jgi:D-alanyl-D-alanine carboxypeptidase/D-alanyl-D-alanine-endopeptidase (penicillin-binding protein 4)|nr:D-alanyl-D-alanine carboxypeptidase/D-alanyl-D-alanine-endopeptidase [Pyrinomonadaceae bacterium]